MFSKKKELNNIKFGNYLRKHNLMYLNFTVNNSNDEIINKNRKTNEVN